MFLRRNKLPLKLKLREWAWPTRGWGRAWRYSLHRLSRLPGSAYSIAAGFACGAAISFTPFVGFHIVLSGIIAWIMRANVLASAVGTIVGNPWTFPFIWVWLYETGNWLLQGEGETSPDYYATFSLITDTLLRLDFNEFVDAALPVFLPMLLSSIPTAFVVWAVFFFPLLRVINGYQRRRRRRLHNRAEHLKEMIANYKEHSK